MKGCIKNKKRGGGSTDFLSLFFLWLLDVYCVPETFSPEETSSRDENYIILQAKQKWQARQSLRESVHRISCEAVNAEQAVLQTMSLPFPHNTRQHGYSKQQQAHVEWQDQNILPCRPWKTMFSISTCRAVRVQSNYLLCFPLICSNNLMETQLIHLFFSFVDELLKKKKESLHIKR